MKSLAKKIILALAVTALGVTFPGPVTAQIYTNVIGLPISQLPDIGTNPITGSDIIPMSNLQGGSLTTVKMNVLNLKSNFLASVSTNLSTLNGVISTNPITVYNDILSGTNAALEAYNVGGDIANAAMASNAVVLAIGDSYTEGTGFPSPSMIFGQRIRAIYGDDGICGGTAAWGGGWYNVPTILNRTPPTNVWPRLGLATISVPDGTNCIYGAQGAAGGQLASNYCQKVGVCFMATPYSTNFALCIWSPSAGVTNFYTIADNATQPTFHMTNWAVASALDWHVSASSLGGTNYLVNVNFLGTNSGVQYWQYAWAGFNNDQILSIGSNVWAQIMATVNPNVVLYSSIHMGTQAGDTSLATHTNLLKMLLGNVSTNCRVVIVGNPPNLASDMRVINAYDRMACQSFGWYYADLWSAFPSFTTSFNGGLMNYSDGGVHASLLGGYARSAALCRLLGIQTPGGVPLDARLIAGQLLPSSLPAVAVTNNEKNVTLYDLTINNGTGAFTVNEQQYNNFDYYQMGGWLRIWNGSGIAIQFGQPITGIGSEYFNAGFGGTLNITNAAALGSVTTATANAGSVTVTNGISAANVTATNLCLAGQFGGITQFYVNANGSNSITVPAGKSYFVTWNSARNLNTLIWTNGYGVGSPVTITNLAWPAPGNLILKSGWILSVYDNSGYPAGGVYYPL